MAGARGANRIYGNLYVTIGAVFKADRAGEGRCHFAVDLAFGSACANRAPANQIGNKLADNHIQEFRGGRQAQRVDIDQQLASDAQTAVHIVAPIQIRIGD